MDEKKLLFYDVEVFQEDAIVVFKDINKEVVKVFHNDFTGIGDLIDGSVLVGYNNYSYDDHILSAILSGWSNRQIKKVNDEIIGGARNRFRKTDFRIRSLDCFQELYQKPGLKKVEGNMGKSIVESGVPFTIERELAISELEEVIAYCERDVDATIDVYEARRWEYFEPKADLVAMYGTDLAWKFNTTTIATKLLVDRRVTKWSELRVPAGVWALAPEDVRAVWDQANGFEGINVKLIEKDLFGCGVTFGFGGLHGSHRGIKKAKGAVLLDVASFYPSIIINLNILGEATRKYQDIREDRFRAKREGDASRSESLKLVLNSVFGLMNNEYSDLCNPRGNQTVCIYGQIMLYELCRRLAPHADILNINTDGAIILPKSDRYKEVAKEWAEEFSFQLDERVYDFFIQKDVNNYLAVEGGDVIVKGADVSRYRDDNFWSNNNARIVDIAIVEKLIHGKDIIDTIMEHLGEPKLFQYVLQAGHTYVGTCDQEGELVGRVNRVFPSKEGAEAVCLFKLRPDGGRVRFADVPERMRLWNGDCAEIPDFVEWVDIDHYYKLIMRKLERWVE